MSQASLIYSMLYNNSTVGFGAPTQRISSGNSTSKASWGSGFWTCGNEFNLNFDMCTQLIK